MVIRINLNMQITIKPIHHRREVKLAIIFPYDKTVVYAVRSIKGIKWTQTHKCWPLPLSKEAFHILYNRLNPLGQIDFPELKTYLENRKQIIKVKTETTQVDKEIKLKPQTIETFANPKCFYRQAGKYYYI